MDLKIQAIQAIYAKMKIRFLVFTHFFISLYLESYCDEKKIP